MKIIEMWIRGAGTVYEVKLGITVRQGTVLTYGLFHSGKLRAPRITTTEATLTRLGYTKL
jgi:hypothetical protein